MGIFGGGPSPQEETIAAEQQSFFNTMQSVYSSVFGTNMAILNRLSSSLEPIIQAGPEQFAFSPGELAAYNTTIDETVGRQYQQVSQQVAQQLAARGGGNTFLPSGAAAEIEANIAQSALQQEALEKLGVTEKGYDIGRQKYFQAIGDLERAPGAIEAPFASLGEATTRAGEAAFKSADVVASEETSPLGGLLGGLIGTAVNAFLPGVGTLVSGITSKIPGMGKPKP